MPKNDTNADARRSAEAVADKIADILGIDPEDVMLELSTNPNRKPRVSLTIAQAEALLSKVAR